MRFGKYNIPDDILWVAGIAVPLLGAALYHHFHADPTDIVTDVQVVPTAPSPTMTIAYNAGPPDTLTLSMAAALWTVQGQMIANATKLALAGLTRDRVRATVQQLQPQLALTQA